MNFIKTEVLPAFFKGGAIGTSLYFTGGSLTAVFSRVLTGEALNTSLVTAFAWLGFDIVTDYVFLSGNYTPQEIEDYNKVFWAVTAIRVLKSGNIITGAKSFLENLATKINQLETKIVSQNFKILVLELKWEIICYLKKIQKIKSIKIPLNEDKLGKMAISFRKKNAILKGEDAWHGGNVCVFEYIDKMGKTRYLVQETLKSTNKHSERLAIEVLEAQGIPLTNVKRIYSELEFCQLASGGNTGQGCKKMIEDKIGTEVEVRFSYDYPGRDLSTKPLRDASIAQRELDFNKLK